MGQRTPFGTYTNEPSVNTAELRAAKKLSLYGTTEPRYCCTSSGYSRIASEMAQKITPGIFSQLRYARSRHSSIQGGSPFFWEISRMTSSERPGGTVSDSISVTKPYLYGWRTWASIPLLIGAPEVLCASQVAEIWPWRKRILQELLGIVNQAT